MLGQVIFSSIGVRYFVCVSSCNFVDRLLASKQTIHEFTRTYTNECSRQLLKNLSIHFHILQPGTADVLHNAPLCHILELAVFETQIVNGC